MLNNEKLDFSEMKEEKPFKEKLNYAQEGRDKKEELFFAQRRYVVFN
jgi:hypothetical protein